MLSVSPNKMEVSLQSRKHLTLWGCILLLLLLATSTSIRSETVISEVHVPTTFRSDLQLGSLTNLSSLSFHSYDDHHKSSKHQHLPNQHSETPTTTTTETPSTATTHKTSTSPWIISTTFGIDRLNRALVAKIKSLRNTELGVPAIQQMFINQHKPTSATTTTSDKHLQSSNTNDTQLVAEFALRLETKLQLAKFAIQDASKLIALSRFKTLPTVVQPCPYDDWASALDQHYDKTQIEIKNYRAPERHVNRTEEEKAANTMVMQALKSFRGGHLSFQRAYFLSNTDLAGEYLCSGTSVQEFAQLRSVLTSSISQKNVILLIDHGGSSVNTDQLELTKTFVTHLVSLLNPRDRLAIVAVAGQYSSHYATGGETVPRLYSGSRDNLVHFARFIDRLNSTKELTNHSFAFAEVFRLLHQIYQHQEATDAVPMQMVYISRGLVSPLTEAKGVLESIAAGQRLLQNPVIINTVAIVLDEKRVMYEKQFMKDVARQNYTKYNIDTSAWTQRSAYNLSGRLFVINQQDSARNVIATATAIFVRLLVDPTQINDQLSANLPTYIGSTASNQPSSTYGSEGDLIVALFKPVGTLGVLGVNMYLNDIVEDAIGFHHDASTYVFIVDRDGLAIMHPSYPRPLGVDQQTPFYTDIRYLEGGRTTGFAHVRQRMLVEPSGTATDSIGDYQRITYSWHRATDLYVVCVATIQPSLTVPTEPFGYFGVPADFVPPRDTSYDDVGLFYDETLPPLLPELVFHRLDLIPIHGNLCRHFKQVATMDGITLFLSASSFSRPFVYLDNYRKSSASERAHNAKSIIAYLKDRTNLLANPGLLPSIRVEVHTLYRALSYLKKRHVVEDPHDKYIIRRYVSTVNGVLQMYPGCVLSYDIEPTRRPWFVKAMQYPGKLVMTEPYLDAGGAGYIVTMAHTLHESVHHTVPTAVVAIDVTIGFLYKLLLAADPNCELYPLYKCFLMEDAGFILAHPSVLDPLTTTKNTRRPLEHVTHIESFMANDILHHRNLVEKRLCVNYANRTRQRYYSFNTSLTEVLTNRVHGERTKYQITAVPGTNIFVAWMNATCDGGAFCPCSTLDRICLNCNRMEPKICECPCECPLFVNDGNDAVDEQQSQQQQSDSLNDEMTSGATSVTEVCASKPEQVAALDSWALNVDLDLQTCRDINCEVYATHTDCLGVMGCEWCQVDVDGETFFSSPFCTQQSSCFNGVLGSATPYGGEGDLGVAMVDSIVPPSYSAIGPVTGAIVALCLVIGFAMYCYRQTVDGSSGDNLYNGNSGQENAPFGMPLARFDYDDINPHEDGDLGGMNTMNRHLLQPQLVVPAADISPYRINAGTYRPAAVHHTESDHGYSTMTPREDSEHQCFALAEPLLRTKRVSSMSDSASVCTSVSSPTNQNSFPVDSSSPRSEMVSPNSNSSSSRHATQTQPPLDPSLTNLKNNFTTSPHHILAPVTVHHPMEMV